MTTYRKTGRKIYAKSDRFTKIRNSLEPYAFWRNASLAAKAFAQNSEDFSKVLVRSDTALYQT